MVEKLPTPCANNNSSWYKRLSEIDPEIILPYPEKLHRTSSFLCILYACNTNFFINFYSTQVLIAIWNMSY